MGLNLRSNIIGNRSKYMSRYDQCRPDQEGEKRFFEAFLYLAVNFVINDFFFFQVYHGSYKEQEQ